jgi:hypothetical protein
MIRAKDGATPAPQEERLTQAPDRVIGSASSYTDIADPAFIKIAVRRTHMLILLI